MYDVVEGTSVAQVTIILACMDQTTLHGTMGPWLRYHAIARRVKPHPLSVHQPVHRSFTFHVYEIIGYKYVRTKQYACTVTLLIIHCYMMTIF